MSWEVAFSADRTVIEGGDWIPPAVDAATPEGNYVLLVHNITWLIHYLRGIQFWVPWSEFQEKARDEIKQRLEAMGVQLVYIVGNDVVNPVWVQPSNDDLYVVVRKGMTVSLGDVIWELINNYPIDVMRETGINEASIGEAIQTSPGWIVGVHSAPEAVGEDAGQITITAAQIADAMKGQTKLPPRPGPGPEQEDLTPWIIIGGVLVVAGAATLLLPRNTGGA